MALEFGENDPTITITNRDNNACTVILEGSFKEGNKYASKISFSMKLSQQSKVFNLHAYKDTETNTQWEEQTLNLK